MKNRSSFNNLFSHDRKVLYMLLSIVMISVLTLTVVYAALSTTLSINGNAEVSAASWDIYLDNVQLNSGSATTGVPTITDKTKASFSTILNKPGDFYEFTIDVVNNGSIDAMIDSVTKTPELSEVQSKYLNYIIEYQNGEVITTKQLVGKNSFVRLKVRLEFRKDVSSSDLPKQAETLNFSFVVNYVQADENGFSVLDDGVYDPYKIGNEVCFDSECFNILSSDDRTVTLFAKYNLYVGGTYDNTTSTYTPYDEATGLQDSTMLGYKYSVDTFNGVIPFASLNYWVSNSALKSEYGTSYPAYVYDSNSYLYEILQSYRLFLENNGLNIEEIRLVDYNELLDLGCSQISCNSTGYSFIWNTSYWMGSAYANNTLWTLRNRNFYNGGPNANNYYGVRPVIEVLKTEI